eukprot:289075-Chlamydomonas_euryale.AAC.2
MQPTAVHQHAVQLVLVGHVGGSLGSEDVDVLGVEVEQLGELVAVVDLLVRVHGRAKGNAGYKGDGG